jgi:hypothetical protein
MSKNAHTEHRPPQADGASKGPNLVLIYTLIALGALLAMACAAMIVWPFYHRH